MSSADNLLNSLDPGQARSRSKLFHTLMVFLKEQVKFGKNLHTKLPTRQRVTKNEIKQHLIYHLTFAQDTSFSVFIEMIKPYYFDLAERFISTLC